MIASTLAIFALQRCLEISFSDRECLCQVLSRHKAEYDRATQEDNMNLRKEQKRLANNNENTFFFSDSIWKIQEQEEEVKRTKLWHLKMFQRHN